MSELFIPTPEEAALHVELDHVMSEETLILAGLNEAVRKGLITEDLKSEWLNEYLDRRNFVG